MPFDDLKTLPEGFAVTPTMQPVAWAVPDRDDGDIWHVTMWRDEAIRAAGGNAFALVPLYTLGVRLSGVAAATATAADVARSVAETPDERHDAATCRGERQEAAKPVEIDGDRPDVGEGWRLLGPDDVQQEGDEWCLSGKTWKPIPPGGRGNHAWCGEARFRRRVTPVPEAARFPAATAMAERRKDRERLLKKIAALRSESHEQQDRLLQACLENERLRSEVESVRALTDAMRTDNVRLRSEVERLRLRPEEREAMVASEQALIGYHSLDGVKRNAQAAAIRQALLRLGGGE
jgi:hypothetical protein